MKNSDSNMLLLIGIYLHYFQSLFQQTIEPKEKLLFFYNKIHVIFFALKNALRKTCENVCFSWKNDLLAQ